MKCNNLKLSGNMCNLCEEQEIQLRGIDCMKMKDLAKLFDTTLVYENDIITTLETITEYKNKMWDKKDVHILKNIIPLLDTLIYEAEKYKEWLGNEVEEDA